MNLTHLYYFKKLAELQHYTRAARELFIAQPTLSGAISSLEKELDAPLFKRNGRSVVLTPHGEVFYEYVCLALRAIEDGTAAVSAKNSASAGTVNIGTIFTVQDDYLPALIQEYERDTENNVVIMTTQGFTNYLIEQLHHGSLDVAFCGRRPNQNDIEYVPVTSRDLALYVRADHPLAHCDEVGFADLEGLGLITYRRGTPIGEKVFQLLRDNGVYNAEGAYDDDLSMGSYLAHSSANSGALMLKSLGGQLFGNLRCIRVREIPAHFYTIYLAYHKKHVHSRAVTDFIEYVRDYHGNDAAAEEPEPEPADPAVPEGEQSAGEA